MQSTNSQFQKSTIGRSNVVPATARAALRGLSRMAPNTAATLAESLFLKPIRLRSPHRELWWATDAEEISLPFKEGKPLTGWIWGWSGPTVLLVHGWGGRGLQMGAFAAPLVEAGFRVVAFDAPGHGRSPGSKTSLPEFANAVTAVMEHLSGVEGVIAHSFGAAATTLALGGPAAAKGPMPDRLVFVSPASDFASIATHFSGITGFTPDVVQRMRRRIERRFEIRWRDAQPQALAHQLKQGLLILHDELDDEIPCEDSRVLAEAWQGAALQVTRGLGHHRILREESTVGRAVKFLRQR